MTKPQVSFQPKCGMEFQCLVHSSAIPIIEWFHNDLLLKPINGVTMWSLDNIHVLEIHSCDQKILGEFICKAESSLGIGQQVVNISEEFIESEIMQLISGEEISNNVRRNVEQQEALPIISASFTITPSTVLLLMLFHVGYLCI